MKNAVTIKTLSAIVGTVMLIGGIGYGFAQALATYATKTELAQTDAKADYNLHALLERSIRQLERILGKDIKTTEDWDQIKFLREEILRIRGLLSDGNPS